MRIHGSQLSRRVRLIPGVLACVIGTACEAPPPETAAEPATTAVTLAAETLELFMEHPYLVAGQRTKFNVHLTVLSNGMPIRSGALTVRGTGPTGKTVTVTEEAPKRPGIYGPVVAFPEAGENEMVLELASDQATETIRVPVMVYRDRAAAEEAAGGGEEGAETSVTFLKEQAWKIGLVHEAATQRRLVERLVVPGQIEPAAGLKAVITPPLSGRILPSPDRGLPVIGERVEAGQVIAVIEPPLAGPGGASILADRAQVHTFVADVDAKLRHAETEVRKAKVSLGHAEVEHERYQRLNQANATSKADFQESELNLRLAGETYQGTLLEREVFVQARADLLAMLASGETTGDGSAEGESPLRTRSLPLRAPLSGTVTAAQMTRGEFVDATRPLFTVIDLGRVWLEAKVSEADLEKVVEAAAASFTLASYPGRRFSVFGEGGGRLVDVGKVIDPSSRTLSIRYELPNEAGLFRIGMFADVGIETARAEDVLAIPESAIVDEDGRPTAFVLVDGEHFAKRDLVLGLRDSGFVEVKDGVSAGERVVTKGAYAIRLASVSSVIPAHGHSH